MKRYMWKLVAVASVAMLHMAPAQAQTRSWVSGIGDDANPCSRTAPCKTFASAISKTSAGGEINVLDPGGFGGVTITKSISIIADHVEAGVLVSGTNAIVVNLANATDNVLLEGLDIEGLGTGLDGVKIVGTGNVVIRRSSIRNFTGTGVNLVGTANARVTVLDSYIKHNGGGVNLQGAGGATNTGFVINSVIDSHTEFAIQMAGPGNVVISGNSLIGGGPKLVISGGGTIVSYGNNVIRGSVSAVPSSTLPLQ